MCANGRPATQHVNIDSTSSDLSFQPTDDSPSYLRYTGDQCFWYLTYWLKYNPMTVPDYLGYANGLEAELRNLTRSEIVRPELSPADAATPNTNFQSTVKD